MDPDGNPKWWRIWKMHVEKRCRNLTRRKSLSQSIGWQLGVENLAAGAQASSDFRPLPAWCPLIWSRSSPRRGAADKIDQQSRQRWPRGDRFSDLLCFGRRWKNMFLLIPLLWLQKYEKSIRRATERRKKHHETSARGPLAEDMGFLGRPRARPETRDLKLETWNKNHETKHSKKEQHETRKNI